MKNVRSMPEFLLRPKKPYKVFTPEVLKKIKKEIEENQNKAKASKPVRHTSSFLCTSRVDGNTAPSLCYIKKGSKESPSVGKYTPRDITLLNQPKYSFSK